MENTWKLRVEGGPLSIYIFLYIYIFFWHDIFRAYARQPARGPREGKGS